LVVDYLAKVLLFPELLQLNARKMGGWHTFCPVSVRGLPSVVTLVKMNFGHYF
jgi:hypothetical protein